MVNIDGVLITWLEFSLVPWVEAMTEYSLHPDSTSSPPPFYPCAKKKMAPFYGAKQSLSLVLTELVVKLVALAIDVSWTDKSLILRRETCDRCCVGLPVGVASSKPQGNSSLLQDRPVSWMLPKYPSSTAMWWNGDIVTLQRTVTCLVSARNVLKVHTRFIMS